MKMRINFEGKRKFVAETRGFEIAVDVPQEKGGDNTAPMPPEYLVASLGSCMGIFATAYLKNAGLETSGFSIDMDWDLSADGNRVGRISAVINTPKTALGDRKNAMLAAASKCLIHNTLRECPEIKIELGSEK
ncbi:MAG TPA: OsmC family protein [Candidatus Omnitrophota bacterium]|nr:OsmC family protein [Candidatus Omnitrophota bacterium]